MLGKHPFEVRDRTVRMVLDRLDSFSSLSAACRDLAPKLNVGIETLRKRVMQAQADSGAMPGSTTEQLAEMAMRPTITLVEPARQLTPPPTNGGMRSGTVHSETRRRQVERRRIVLIEKFQGPGNACCRGRRE